MVSLSTCHGEILFTLSRHIPLGSVAHVYRVSKVPSLTLSISHLHPGPSVGEDGDRKRSLGWDRDGEAGQVLENLGGRTIGESSLKVPGMASIALLDFI